jgi:hypothetical protein
MSGTRTGGQKARDANKAKHGPDFYRLIGAKGGAVKGIKKGYALHPELAGVSGAVGGRISRRNGEHLTPVDKRAMRKARKALDRARVHRQRSRLSVAVKAAFGQGKAQG